MSALDRVLDALNAHGSAGRGTAWQCPAHDDRSPSLSVTNGAKGVILNCHAGCDTADVVAALDLTMPDLFDEPLEKRDRPQVVAEYTYCDRNGEVTKVVRRIEPGYNGERKTFRQFRPDGTPGVKGIPNYLYRLPEVLATAQAGGLVYVVEGEKDVENLRALGLTATCNIGGAGKWSPSYCRFLEGVSGVVVIADRDEPGRKHAAEVAESVARAGIPVQALEPAKGKDVSDHLAAGLGFDDLVPMESRPTNPKTPVEVQDADPKVDSGISGTPIGESGWDPPVPLDAPELPSFPVDRLGGIAPFITATAASLQVPVDLVAFAALGTISTATGGRRQVQVKPDWRESTALFLAALADSSEKKTPALNAAAAPLREIENELIEEARPKVEETAQQIRIVQGQMAKAEQKAATSDKPDVAVAEAEGHRMRLDELGEAPNLPRLLVRDTTMEAIGKLMFEQSGGGQGGRLGSLASEGGLLKVAAGLYGSNGKANTDLLLEAYTGGPYTIDRTGRASARMASTFLALALIVQPGVISGIEKQNPEFRQSGLLGRFLYGLPAPTEEDTFDSPAVPVEVSSAYRNSIRALVEKVWNTDTMVTLTLSEDGRKEFGEFYNRFAKRRKPGGDLHDLADWAGKLRGQLVRIAACRALYENPLTTEITRDQIADAISLAPYFIRHARAVFDLMGKNREGKLKPLRDVLAWLRDRTDPMADFSARDVWQALKGREWAEDMDAMNDVLLQLEEYGWIALIPPPDTAGKRGRKPSPRFAVHPNIKEAS